MAEFPELRRQIEELAFQAVMADPDKPASGPIQEMERSLDGVLRSARQARAAKVESAAAAFRDALRVEPGCAAVWQEGLARLQQAMAEEVAVQAASSVSVAQDPELLRDFVLESREHLAAIEVQVLTLERQPQDAEALNAIFRGFHTVKGLAGFLELWDIQKLAHEVETVLDAARNHRFTISAGAIDVILESADELRAWLAYLESAGSGDLSSGPGFNAALSARIRALYSDGPEQAPSSADLSVMVSAVAEQERGQAEAQSQAQVLAHQAPTPEGSGSRTQAAAPEAESGRGATRAQSGRAETTAVRVDTAKLDYLVDMAGEMVIAQSLVRHDPDWAALRSPRLQRNMAQLTRITGELQKTAMALRLVPIGPLFRRMERLVRDLARQFGKKVEMETQGDEIELDRNIVEGLADPMMHMVRNALDHGIESPQEREGKGKNPVAKLLLRGRHQAGQVVIEIADDGRGLDRERIAAKAIEKGLISANETLTDNEIYNLIFHAGFSTAAQVTNVSGRGVGMDVVRRHIERLRGRMEIRSAPGQGAQFLLKLPLTLAIIDGLVVGVGQERYIAPLFAVRELLRPSAETVWTVQNRAEMALIRGELMPVTRLYKRFRVKPRSEDPLASVMLVAEVEGKRFCLLVDELIGKQEVVIKSLGETFKNVPGIAGGAILGDGRVGLILDLERLLVERNDEAAR